MQILSRASWLARAFLTVAFATLAVPAQSGWVQWTTSSGGNGHYYLAVYVPGGINWADARAKAQALGGDLATITSAAENSFVFLRIADPIFWRQPASGPVRLFGPWLGGFQPPGSGEPLAQWSWVTGESWSYTSWDSGEPNNLNGNEDHLHFFAPGTNPLPRWNDLVQTQSCPGFVVESAVPPVAAYVGLGVGCAPAGQSPPLLAPVAGELPRLGSTSHLRVSGYPVSAVSGFVALGLGNRYVATLSGPARLPISLAPLGWTGCNQLIQADSFFAYVPAGGFFDQVVAVPNHPLLLGEAIFAQALVLAPGDARTSNSILGCVGP